MGFYKESYRDRNEELIFGNWTIALSIFLGTVTVILTFVSYANALDYLETLGANRLEMPIASFAVAMIAGGFAVFFGILNLFAFIRRLHLPKFPKFYNRTYKFNNNDYTK